MHSTINYQKLALDVAKNSPCKKRKVGAVVVGGDNYTTGHNHNFGSDCEDDYNNTLASVIHAEVAALEYFTEQYGNSATDIYVTHPPCDNCKAAIAKAGIPESNIHIVEEFMKFDSGKLRYGLIPPEATKALAEVLTYGAKKYKPNNWQQVDDPTRYVDALYRHLEAWRAGEKHDKESGLLHLAHALTNIAFLIHFESENN